MLLLLFFLHLFSFFSFSSFSFYFRSCLIYIFSFLAFFFFFFFFSIICLNVDSFWFVLRFLGSFTVLPPLFSSSSSLSLFFQLSKTASHSLLSSHSSFVSFRFRFVGFTSDNCFPQRRSIRLGLVDAADDADANSATLQFWSSEAIVKGVSSEAPTVAPRCYLPVPYSLPPEKYSAADRSWAVDKAFGEPDWRGATYGG